MVSIMVYYLVHIHTPRIDYYALRDSLENAQEEVFNYAQSEWTNRFPGVDRPISKTEVVELYFQSFKDDVYFHLIDIESEGNTIMEDL